MNLNIAVVHHRTAGAGEASLENRILTLQGDNCGPRSQQRMCEVMLSQGPALD